MSHKLSKKEKQQKGGQLARALGLRIAPRTGLYAVGRGLTAEQVFDLAHGVVVKKEYCEAVANAVKALESVSLDCQMALNGTWDKSDDGFESTLKNVDGALRGLGVEPPVEYVDEEPEEGV